MLFPEPSNVLTRGLGLLVAANDDEASLADEPLVKPQVQHRVADLAVAPYRFPYEGFAPSVEAPGSKTVPPMGNSS